MGKRTVYYFIREETSELPPRFTDLSLRLSRIGITYSEMIHPDANTHLIELSLPGKVNPKRLENIFTEYGYKLRN